VYGGAAAGRDRTIPRLDPHYAKLAQRPPKALHLRVADRRGRICGTIKPGTWMINASPAGITGRTWVCGGDKVTLNTWQIPEAAGVIVPFQKTPLLKAIGKVPSARCSGRRGPVHHASYPSLRSGDTWAETRAAQRHCQGWPATIHYKGRRPWSRIAPPRHNGPLADRYLWPDLCALPATCRSRATRPPTAGGAKPSVIFSRMSK